MKKIYFLFVAVIIGILANSCVTTQTTSLQTSTQTPSFTSTPTFTPTPWPTATPYYLTATLYYQICTDCDNDCGTSWYNLEVNGVLVGSMQSGITYNTGRTVSIGQTVTVKMFPIGGTCGVGYYLMSTFTTPQGFLSTSYSRKGYCYSVISCN